MRKIISQVFLLLVKQKFWDKISVQDPINLIQGHLTIIISSTSIFVSDSILIIFQITFIEAKALSESIKFERIRCLFQSMSKFSVPIYSQYCFIMKLRANLLL